MNKGISYFFGYNMGFEERVKLIKDAGFDSVITSTDKRFRSQNGSLRRQVKLFKKYGLKLSSLHMAYISEELPYFWKEGKKGEKLTKNLIKDVKQAKKYGFTCVVVHLKGLYSTIGENRLLKVLEYCKKVNIPLAIENLTDRKIFLKVFENIKHPMMKFCFDVGHRNAFDKEYDYLANFGDKLITLHLHDNDGTGDQHTIYGNIDWKALGNQLKSHTNLTLDFELIPRPHPNISPEEFLKQGKNLADQLENYILN